MPWKGIDLISRHLHELQRRASGAYDGHQRNTLLESSQRAASVSLGQYRESPQTTTSLRRDAWPPHATSASLSHTAVLAPTNTAFGDQDPSQLGELNPTVSTWAFCRDARQALLPEANQGAQYFKDRQKLTYQFSRQTEPDNSAVATSLPPKSYISHLAQVCDFRLNASHYCFNLATFQEKLEKSDLKSLESASSLWHTKILAILALGKLFMEKGASAFGPPGVREFQRAVAILPTTVALSQEPLIAIETLLLLSIYSQAADMHHVAYLYTGQAARLARSSGLTRRARASVESNVLDSVNAQKLWWTICVLDQKLALTIDADFDSPVAEHDEIAVSFGEDYNPNDTGKSPLRAHLCIANFMTTVARVLAAYSSGSTTSDTFCTRISTQLVAARGLGEILGSSHHICQGEDLTTISRPVATLYLSYYQAVLHATKPFLIKAISMYIPAGDVPNTTLVSEGVLQLLRTCVKAAAYSLNIIHALHEQGVLETFNFWDLEATSTSALILILAHGVFPDVTDGSFLSIAKDVLRDMSNRGNIPAGALLQELNDIHGVLGSTSLVRLPTPAPSLHLSLHLKRNGQALNDAITNVLEVEAPLTDNLGLSRSQTTQLIPPVIEGFQQLPEEIPQEPTLMPDLDPMEHTATDEQSMSYAPDFYLDTFDDFQMPFDLDMPTGSDGWLDFV